MGDRMSGLNLMGFAVCVSGISLHVGLKTYYSKSKFIPLLYVVGGKMKANCCQSIPGVVGILGML